MNLAEELSTRINNSPRTRAKSMFAEGKRPSEIARELGLSKTTVWRYLNDVSQSKKK